MAFDDTTRNRLQRFVSVTRGILNEEFTRQLQQVYGMDPATGEVTDIDGLKHLDDQRLETAHILRQIMDHYLATETTSGDVAQRIVLDRIVREQAFTILNRLAALRMMEARGILRESVGKGLQSQSFQLYQQVASGALGDTGETYRCFLLSLFDLFAVDLPALFDRYAPQSRLFPRETVLADVLEAINHPDLESLWAEDETIGWIYQYFNSKEERQDMRKASQAPRNSRELAVRNQFFTPRYVVEFLVDNTLGRLWLNWTGGATCLHDRCRYLNVKPDELPEAAKRLRDPRTIKLLDPACGSMHFGLYAFDLFLEIYREAWEWEANFGPGSLYIPAQTDAELKPFSEAYPDADAFQRDVPRLIIEHNIFGVEIDPRAAQIASLALWLRAQRAWYDMAANMVDRPTIRRSNVVAAVAPPAEIELRNDLKKGMDELDAELFEKTLLLLKGLPELGILLKVERELPALIRQVYGERGDLFRMDDEEKWHEAETRLQRALIEYALAAQSTFQSHLFIQDALEGLRLIDMTQLKYDVVVMNPPFGTPTNGSRSYIRNNFFTSRQEIFAAFLSRSQSLISHDGRIGILSSRTCFFLPSLEDWRAEVFFTDTVIECAADLGLGVLDDALVEAACYVVSRNAILSSKFIDCLSQPNKEESLLSACSSELDSLVHYKNFQIFDQIPYRTLSYWAPDNLIELYQEYPSIENSAARVRIGLQTSNDYRFLRLAWETNPIEVGKEEKWIPFAKGGEYQPFFDDIHLQVLWAQDAKQMKAFARQHASETGSTAGNGPLREFAYYFKGGLTYPERTTSEFGARALPDGCITGTVGPGIHVDGEDDRLFLLAWLNSRVVRALIELSIGRGDAVHSGSAARHYNVRMVGNLPMISVDISKRPKVISEARKCLANLLAIYSLDETSRNFIMPNFSEFGSLDEFARTVYGYEEQLRIECNLAQASYEELFLSEFGARDELKSHIDEFVGKNITDFPSIDVSADELNEIYEMSLDKLVDCVAKRRGQSRQITKKSYFGDRRVELASLFFERHPLKIVEARLKGNILPASYLTKMAQSLVSLAFGSYIGRYDPTKSITLSSRLNNTDLFSPVSGMLAEETSQGREANKVNKESIHVVDEDSYSDLASGIISLLGELFPKSSELVEHEILAALRVGSIREYLISPNKFFSNHLSTFSKSRRKAPIYWPLSTVSGQYILWLYYPALTDQTLYTAANDFVGPKLAEVSKLSATLNTLTNRTLDEERQLEKMRDLEVELKDLQNELLSLAPVWKPNYDDGVQITAAPLWRLFRHKPWRKVLKENWAKLERGDYDWAQISMIYWPDRVREKCRVDESIAIAHNLEDLYQPQE